MSAGEFLPGGYYERNADGSQKKDTNGNPIFHPETVKHALTWPVGPDNSVITEKAWFGLKSAFAGAHGHIWFTGTSGGKQQYFGDFDFTLAMDVRQVWQFPADADGVTVELITDSDNPVAWSIEAQAK